MIDRTLLNKVSRAKREETCLENHPLVNCDLEVRFKYLSALSLVICIDNVIHWREKKYLQMMMYALDVPQETLDAILIQGKDWDESMIKDVVAFVRQHHFETALLFDIAFASVYDGWLHPQEKDLLRLLEDWLVIDEQIVHLLKIISQVPFQADPIAYYHANKMEFYDNNQIIDKAGCCFVKPLFAMICHDFKWKKNKNKGIRND